MPIISEGGAGGGTGVVSNIVSTDGTVTVGGTAFVPDLSVTAPSPLLVATKTIANADVLTLPTTPVQVLGAPGLNKTAIPVHATIRMTWVADYTNIDATATLTLTHGTSTLLTELQETTFNAVSGLLAGGGPDGTNGWFGAAEAVTAAPSLTHGLSSAYDSDLANKPISLSATNGLAGNFTGGNAGNALTVTLLYYVVSF